MKKVLYYIGIVFASLFSGAFLAEAFVFFREGIFFVILTLVLSFACGCLVYFCYKGLDKLKNSSQVKSTTVPEKNSNTANQRVTNLNISLTLIKDCLAYKYTDEYPVLENELKQSLSYLDTFKQKDYEVNAYLTDILNKFLQEYKEIVTSPVKDTNQGKNIILKIEESLKMINETLGKIYEAHLDGKQSEITSMVQGLKNKLIVDGYLQSANSPFASKE